MYHTWERERRNAHIIWSENLKGRGPSEDLAIDRKIILKLSYGNKVMGGKVWTRCIWLSI
jgi:hypothetical protein